jgi:protein SCO1/2
MLRPFQAVAPALLVLALPLAAQTDPPAGHEHHHHEAMATAPEPAETRQIWTKMAIPDVAVINQDGKPVKFYSDLIQGKVVMMNFIFTSCTTICPPMGATFGNVQKLLGDRAGRDVHLVSVSVDPANDTPERMKAWGQKFNAGPGWTLVTGDRETITQLLKALGVYNANINDHTPLVLAGTDGKWTRAYGLAPPSKLVQLIDGIEDAKKEARP